MNQGIKDGSKVRNRQIEEEDIDIGCESLPKGDFKCKP